MKNQKTQLLFNIFFTFITFSCLSLFSNEYFKKMNVMAQMSTNKSIFSTPTKWEETGVNLTSLLNSGWQISGHSSNRAATSPGASGYKPYDEETVSFLLTKNSKYILCFVVNPSPPIANSSGCRKLN